MDQYKKSRLSFRSIASDLVVYTIFSLLVCLNSLEHYSTENFQLTDTIRNLFSGQFDVTNMNEFWKFLENDVINGLYWNSWYCQNCKSVVLKYPDNVLPIHDSMYQNILYENKLVGLPLLRQLRTRNDSCHVHEDFQNAIKVCHSPYAEEFEDTNSFNPDSRNFTEYSAWNYQDPENMSGSSFNGNAGVYSNGGSVQILSHFKEETQKIINELKQNLWITQATRFISLDFNVYNPNINRFCIVSLVFEFSATGNIFNFQSFDSLKLFEYTTTRDFILLGSEIAVSFFVIYYLIEEFVEMKKIGLGYFKEFWNVVDILVVTTSILQIVAKILNFLYTYCNIEELLEKTLEYPDFSNILKFEKSLHILSSMNVFVVWIKFLKYLTFNKMTYQLFKTLSLGAADLSGFSILFLVVDVSFVQLGYLMFGVQLENFKTFRDSFFTLFRMILGDFNFNEIEEASPYLGPIFFVVYIFFVFFVLLNVFLAIINDTYSLVKSEKSEEQNPFKEFEFQKTPNKQIEKEKESTMIDANINSSEDFIKARKSLISRDVLNNSLVPSLENRIENLEDLITRLNSRLQSLWKRMDNSVNKKPGLKLNKKRMGEVFDRMVYRE
ncbi:polycystin-2-like [Lepeophtheirus salmonis]|uniref:polycystin-2-like n=1 Tax=Lepeophtheirus salmonis TaxID=72036 RepID=UPI001AE22490|nr:polycystin-2-like [Lepeophtheirus salmonis]